MHCNPENTRTIGGKSNFNKKIYSATAINKTYGNHLKVKEESLS